MQLTDSSAQSSCARAAEHHRRLAYKAFLYTPEVLPTTVHSSVGGTCSCPAFPRTLPSPAAQTPLHNQLWLGSVPLSLRFPRHRGWDGHAGQPRSHWHLSSRPALQTPHWVVLAMDLLCLSFPSSPLGTAKNNSKAAWYQQEVLVSATRCKVILNRRFLTALVRGTQIQLTLPIPSGP